MAHTESINWIGLQTLYLKEVRRFMKVYNQTLFAPMITALLFLAVFSLAIGNRVSDVGDVPFLHFMAAGLIMMSVVQNAFANSSSSLIMGKIMGTLIDYLMPPLSATEMMVGMVGAAITRGIMVGCLVGIAIWCFTPFGIAHPAYALLYILLASTLLALLGIFGGIFAETFDQMSAVTSYIITPLAFLSGTFYSVHNLPTFWYEVSQYNPFFYMIDGFRYGLTGYSDSSVHIGITYLIISTLILWTIVHVMLSKGYRIKQ